jgi:hypothetical protein
MDTLGPHFQIEVNKFKFLNELVNFLENDTFEIGYHTHTHTLILSHSDSIGEQEIFGRHNTQRDSN